MNNKVIDIAVVGMAGRFPGADSVTQFWENICEGKESIRHFSDQELLQAGVCELDIHNSNYVKASPVLADVDKFDAGFFKIPPIEAELIDPQLRLLLQCAWETLEDAGTTMSRAQNIAVFVGGGGVTTNYYSHFVNRNSHFDKMTAGATHLGNDKDFLATYVSYKLNLTGPSMTVQTACSTSLVALHQACLSLRNNECEMALAGGVTIRVPHIEGYFHKEGHIVSKSGHVRTFDETADGVIFGSGLGLVLIKPLDQAITDGNHIYAVIKGSAISNDGKGKMSYAASSARGQIRCITDALANADVDASSIGFVEAHGTGTYMGDPEEVKALSAAFKKQTQNKEYCAIGAVKTNIGHLEAAAGITGFIKAALALHYRVIPPTLHFNVANPRIKFEKTPFYVNNTPLPWTTQGDPRRAAVNSLGVGGTNAFMILEEYQAATTAVKPEDSQIIVPLSAKTPEALKGYAKKLQQFVQRQGKGRGWASREIQLADLAYTLQVGREAMDYRVAFIVSNLAELIDAIIAFLADIDLPSAQVVVPDNEIEDVQSHYFAEDDDQLEVLSKWFNESQWQQLAQLWVGEYDIDWHTLYVDDRPQRISLPTYAFALDHHWIDSGHLVAETTELHPLLHVNTSDLGHQSFTSHFSGEEFFLRDHRVKTGKQGFNQILPGVAYLEIAREAVDRASVSDAPSTGIVLRDIVWLQPNIINQPREVSIALFANEQSDSDIEELIDYEIYSHYSDENGDHHEDLHCQGQACYGVETPVVTIDVALLKAKMNGDVWHRDQLYPALAKMGLDYGPTHQGIQRILVGDRQLMAELELPPTLEVDFDQYMLHPSLMDSALQATNALVVDLNNPPTHPLVPFSLASVHIIAPCEKKMIVWVRYTENSQPQDKLIKLDIELYDLLGNLCIKMNGFTARLIGKDNKESMKRPADRLFATPVWQPSEISRNPVVVDNPPTPQLDQYLIVCHMSGIDSSICDNLLGEGRCIRYDFDMTLNLAQNYVKLALSLFDLLKDIFAKKSAKKQLVQIVVADRKHENLLAGLSGMLKSATLENPGFNGQLILTEPEISTILLAEQLKENTFNLHELVIKYEKGTREVLDWQEIPDSIDNPPTFSDMQSAFNDQGVYLITGGLGGLGLIFAKEVLSRTSNAKVVLTGRGHENDFSEEKRALLAELNQLCHEPQAQVVYRSMDLNDVEDINTVVAEILANYKQLNGIFHSAGMNNDDFIINKSAADFEQVLMPKVIGTYNLDVATKNCDIDFMVLFSSLTSAIGNLGQTDYAAANGFLDQFGAFRNAKVELGYRRGQTLSINWPLWQEGGMGQDNTSQEVLRKTTGIEPMRTSTGISAFYRSLALRLGQSLVMEGDLVKIHQTLLGNEAEDQSKSLTPVEQHYIEGLVEKTEHFLSKQLSGLLKIPVHKIDPGQSMDTYGIDSILAIDLTNKLEETFGGLSKTLFFEYQTIRELTGYFINSHAAQLSGMLAAGQNNKTQSKATPVERNEQSPGPRKRLRFSRRQAGLPQSTMNATGGRRLTEQQDIAIIGLSGRYPQSRDINEYWQNLAAGKDCISAIPDDRWDWQEYYSEDRTVDGHHYSRWGGFIDGVDQFDPRFFNISPREARTIDPQERLFLQHAWMAVEDAGFTRDSLQIPFEHDLPGQVGVYAGVMYGEYQLLGVEASNRGQRMGIASNLASIANRVSYVMNLHGPSMTIDTMCSSSLTTIHLACQDLKQGHISLGIAGGVNVTIHANKYLMLSAGQFISGDGHCQSFGEGGDGYIPAEGVGVVVLKRMSEALADGHNIYGVIKGSALSHGGKTNGYTVPNPQAQASAISRAMREANIDPRHISYIEAHGTGTKLGDPIEIAALNKAFYQHQFPSAKQPKEYGFCAIGSAKSNIGHAESAAGIAGLTKVLLQMKYRQLVPSLHSERLNPHIDFEQSAFDVNQVLRPWGQPVIEGQSMPRIAGISSFGAGGSNAHMLIQEYQSSQGQIENSAANSADVPVMIPLSARTPEQLKQKAADLQRFIVAQLEHEQSLNEADRAGYLPLSIVNMAYTLQVGREAMGERLGIIVESLSELAAKLLSYVNGVDGDSDIEALYRDQVKGNKESMSLLSQDEDMIEAVEKWISRRKLPKLVDLWVKGLSLDWLKLYAGVKPQLISLPTYPFAEERYWVDIDYSVSPQANEPVSERLHPLVHQNISDLTTLQYCSHFSTLDPVARSYQDQGQAHRLISAMGLMEMARFAAQTATASLADSHDSDGQVKSIQLRDVVWGQPCLLADSGSSTPVNLALHQQGEQLVAFEIYSSHAQADDKVHCQGYVEPVPESVASTAVTRMDIAQLKTQVGAQVVHQLSRVSELYQCQQQVLARLQLDDDQLDAAQVLDPQLLDGALEAALALAGVDQALPNAVTSVRIIYPCTADMYAWVRFNAGQDSEQISFDIDLLDAHGNVCIELLGVSYQFGTVSADIPTTTVAPLTAVHPETAAARQVSFADPIELPLNFKPLTVTVDDGEQIAITAGSVDKPIGIMLTVPSEVVRPSVERTILVKGTLVLPQPADVVGRNIATAVSTPARVKLLNNGEGIYSLGLADHQLDDVLVSQIRQALNVVGAQDDIKVLMLVSQADAFLTGDTLAHNLAISEQLYQDVVDFAYPVIAAVEGDATGAGMMLAALCDFMVLAKDSSYGFSEFDDTAHQLLPHWPEYQLWRYRMGHLEATQLMYIATESIHMRGSERAAQGWSCQIVDGHRVISQARQLATNLSQKTADSLRLLKLHLARDLTNAVKALKPHAYPVATQMQQHSDVPHANISLKSPGKNMVLNNRDSVLLVQMMDSGRTVNLNNWIAGFETLATQLAQHKQFKSVVICCEHDNFLPSGDWDLALINQWQQTLAGFTVPVIGAFNHNATDFAWLASLCFDVCVYQREGQFGFADDTQDKALSLMAAQLMLSRLGPDLGRELVLTGQYYSGLTLQTRLPGLPEATAKQVVDRAVQTGQNWANVSYSQVQLFKQHFNANLATALHSDHSVSALWTQDRDIETAMLISEPKAVNLNSSVISAIAYPDGVIRVEMADREAKNMFSDAFIEGMLEVFDHIEQSNQYKVVVLTGYDNYFASGGTKEVLLAIQQGTLKYSDAPIYELPLKCKLPVISAMQGHGIGAGWSLGMFADLIVFSENSTYSTRFMNFGFTPGAGSTLSFPTRIGYDLGREVLISAQEYDGRQLKSRGMSCQMAPGREVVKLAMALATKVARLPADHLVGLKSQLANEQRNQLEQICQIELDMHEQTFVGKTDTLEQIEKSFYKEGNEVSQSMAVVAAPVAVAPLVVVQVPVAVQTVAVEPVVDAIPVASLAEITANLRQMLAQELYMDAHEIDADAQFVDLGLDSITGVTWVRNINDKYGLSLEATKVYSYPTLAQLSAHVQSFISAKTPAVPAPVAPAPATTAGVSRIKDITANLKQMLAAELYMEADEIDLDAQFVDLGLDSITGVTWVRNINDKYGSSLEATKVYSYPTLAQLSAHVDDSLAPQAPSAAPVIAAATPVAPVRVAPVASSSVNFDGHFVINQLTSWREKWHQAGRSNQHYQGDIAVIGMAGQFPGADNLDDYWQNIAGAVNSISEIPAGRWDVGQYYQSGKAVAGKTNSRWMGALNDYDLFDPLFFTISPAEAENMDPQQRLFLQSCWHSIEDAGYNPRALSGARCGVFVGCANGDYNQMSRHNMLSAQGLMGSAISILAARISYLLNLQGPCLSIDTACSSSLVSVAHGCDSLRNHESDIVLAGGVHVMAGPDMHIMTTQAGMLSQDGQCFTFDQRANGFVPGEGVGVLMLKRLDDAQQDHDNVVAVIQGWGVNQDGKTNGITAPNPQSQTRLQQHVYDKFNIDPANIGLIEAHGTGTKLGDPIEVEGLQQSFAKYTDKRQYCALSSVKSNIGHGLTAAGISGLIKVILAIKAGKLPPTVNFERLNEHISLDNTPFFVNDKLQDWALNGMDRRRAAVSSFGFSGTNAHMVVAEPVSSGARVRELAVVMQNNQLIVPLSARSQEQLQTSVKRLLTHLNSNNSIDLLSLSYTLQIGREAMDERLVIMATDINQLAGCLGDYLDGKKVIDGLYHDHVRAHKAGMSIIDSDDDMKQTIVNKWLQGRQLDKLAEFWVKGLTFDWLALYGEDKPARISLPTYPFARERYWIDGDHGADIGGEQASQLHPLLHLNTSDLFQQSFTSRFSGNERVLSDHQVDGSKFMPATGYLEMARAGVMDAMPTTLQNGNLSIHHVSWLRPLVADNGLDVQLALHGGDNDQVDFDIYTLDAQQQDVMCCQGKAHFGIYPQPPALDLAAISDQMTQGQLGAGQLYEAIALMGINHGPAYRGVTRVEQGQGQLLAHIELPSVMDGSENDYVLHPCVLDCAFHVSVALIGDLAQLAGKTALPYALGSLHVVAPCTTRMQAWVRYAANNPGPGSAEHIVDIDLCDNQGQVCVEVRGLASKIASGPSQPSSNKGSQHQATSLQSFTPVYSPLTDGPNVNLASHSAVLLLAGTAEQLAWLQQDYPNAVTATIEQLPARLSEQKFAQLMWLADDVMADSPDSDDNMLAVQQQGVYQVFGLIKALFAADYTFEPLQLTLLTRNACAVKPGDQLRPQHSAVHGLIGTLAKEYPHWQVRMLDVDTLPSARECLSLPVNPDGDVYACRLGSDGQSEWLQPSFALLTNINSPARQQLVADNARCAQQGVYLIIGGTGGLGEAFSQHLVSRYDAKVVWIGRKALNRDIELQLARLGELGSNQPWYLSADATDSDALEQVKNQVLQRHGVIHGVVHSAMSLQDQGIGNMDAAKFELGVAAKVDVSVNMDRVFGELDLDFMLFFNSINAFVKGAGQCNYSAGCTFKDSFSHYLNQQRPYPVKVVNWGYWGSIGVVANAMHGELMANMGFASIDVASGLAALDQLLLLPMAQMAIVAVFDQRLATAHPFAHNRITAQHNFGNDDLLASAQQTAFVASVTGAPVSLPPVVKPITKPIVKLVVKPTPRQVVAVVKTVAPTAQISQPIATDINIPVNQTMIVEHIQQAIRDAMDAAIKVPSAAVEADKAFVDYGVDSIVGVTLVNEINRRLGMVLQTTVLFDYGNVELLSQHIVDEFGSVIRQSYSNESASTVVAASTPVAPAPVARTSRMVRQVASPAPVASTSVVVTATQAAPVIDLGLSYHRLLLERPGDISDMKIELAAQGPLSDSQVCVAIKAFSLNFGDLLCVSGMYPTMPAYPFTPGYDGSGVVVAVGKGVKKVKVGDAVIVEAGEGLGAHASAMVCEQQNVAIKPRSMSYEEAAALPVVSMTMIDAFDKLNMKPGESILIQTAAGGTGLVAVQLAKHAGATIFATAGSQHKLDYLQQIGVDHSINYREVDFEQTIMDMTDGRGVDVVINTLAGEAIQKGMNCLCSGGRYVEIAMTALKSAKAIDLSILSNNQTFFSIDMRKFALEDPHKTARLRQQMFDLYQQGVLRSTISHTFAFDQIVEAYQALADRDNIGKIIVTVDQPYQIDMAAYTSALSGAGIGALQDDIAIIGMSGRFADSDNLEQFWQHLANGDDLVTEVSRWLPIDATESPDQPYSSQGSFVSDIDMFDPLFFKISPLEAVHMDPQQRIFLEQAWTALEDAGYVGGQMSQTRCGVYAACIDGLYDQHFDSKPPGQAFWGNACSVIPARIAYYLNLHGPAIAVDTACSSSLVAIHLACQALWLHETDMALAGGIFIQSTPKFIRSSNRAGMLSLTGKCHTFDAAADGFIAGEGVGVVTLKRLSEAQRDHDNIHGVIIGSGLNQDGATNGITAPSSLSQQRLERSVYERFNINPRSIELVEAHGTGTKLGDPIEFAALSRSFGESTDDRQFCAIGSVKTNIGHAVTAAGVAGVLKVVKAMKQQQLPPSLHYRDPNPAIDFANSPFYVNDSLKPWLSEDGQPRRGAVSSFGFSGTNAHIVIEEAPLPLAREVEPAAPGYLVMLSALSQVQLKTMAANLARHVKADSSIALADVSHTLFVGRTHLLHRLSCVVTSHAQLINSLERFVAGDQVAQLYNGTMQENGIREQAALKKYANQCLAQCRSGTNVAQYIENLNCVADMYVQGYQLNFEHLFVDDARRLSLPTYPFAKESYWASKQAGQPLVPTKVAQSSSAFIRQGKGVGTLLHPLVHRNTSVLSQQNYSSDFSGDEFFLADHQVQLQADSAAQKLLPAVAYLEMVTVAVQQAIPQWAQMGVISVQNVIWIQPLVVDAPIQVDIALFEADSSKDSQQIDFEIYQANSDIVHCQGQVVIAPVETPDTVDVAEVRAMMNQGEFSAERVYDVFNQLGLRYGPAHQGVTGIHQGKGQLLAELQLAESLLGEAELYTLHPAMLDSALQACIGVITDLNQAPGAPSLPFALDSIHIFAPCPAQMWAWVTQSAAQSDVGGDNLTRMDIVLLDAQGQTCVQIKGFSTRALDGHVPTPAAETFDDVYYQNMIARVLNNEISADDAGELEQ